MQKMLEWISRLISFDTVSANSNLELIDTITASLTAHGFICYRTSDPKEPKANLFASLPGKESATEGGLVLSGHTDVVPVAGQNWETDPFQAVLKDERIYGRGACDMKGFLAVMLALAPTFKSMKLKRPLHFAFSYNEEIGCNGVPHLLEDIKRRNITPTACIVGEPSSMELVVGHKGINVFQVSLTGLAAHSSLTLQGCNAIDYAAELITYIRSIADEFKFKGPFDPAYDVPFTTLSTNRINGGNGDNIIPASCEFIFECRNLPQNQPLSVEEKIRHFIETRLLPKMQGDYPHARIALSRIASAPSFECSPTTKIYQTASELLLQGQVKKVAYATESGLFQGASIPTLICGPGNIEQAHRANEYVTVEQLCLCEAFLTKIVKQWCQ